MTKKPYIFLLMLFKLAVSCSETGENEPDNGTGGTVIRLGTGQFSTRVVDDDNLASEQVVDNISVFFTDPSSDDIVYSYVDVGFSTSGDYRVVSVPLEPADLGEKDIYVITNYDDFSVLEALTTITEMEQVRTPEIDKSNNLEAGQGFCMYGMLAGFDFTDTSAGSPIVNVERTCAKLRITLSFPGNPRLSADNSYLVAKAATYTYVMEETGNTLSPVDYFNFASETELTLSGTVFTGIAYVYEADELPQLYIYTHMNGSTEAQEFMTDLPLPERNYLYDLDVRIYEDIGTTRSGSDTGYRMEATVTAFDGNGNLQYINEY